MNIALLYRARLVSSQADAQLDAHFIETGARRSALGITGFLLAADGYVYELLEGEFSAVSSAFTGVLANAFLCDIEMLSNATITKRVCPQWSHGVLDAAHEASAVKISSGKISSGKISSGKISSGTAAKVKMLHHFATRFGSSQPVLRDFLARIGQEITTPAMLAARSASRGYALAG